MLEVDFSDVLRAAAEMGGKGAAVVDAIEPVLERSAVNVKRAMAEEFKKHRHFRRIAPDVSYDRIGHFTSTLGYEIGPTPTMDAGSLAGIAVEGGANGGGGTVKIDHILDAEGPKTEAMIMAALGFL